MKPPAQRAFEAWCSGPGSVVDPATLEAAWQGCSPATRAAWERVAAAIGPGIAGCDYAVLEARILANPNRPDPTVNTGRRPFDPPDPRPVPPRET